MIESIDFNNISLINNKKEEVQIKEINMGYRYTMFIEKGSIKRKNEKVEVFRILVKDGFFVDNGEDRTVWKSFHSNLERLEINILDYYEYYKTMGIIVINKLDNELYGNKFEEIKTIPRKIKVQGREFRVDNDLF